MKFTAEDAMNSNSNPNRDSLQDLVGKTNELHEAPSSNVNNFDDNSINKDVIFKILKIKKINNWTDEEDKKLMELVETANVKSWKKIAECFPGKTQIQCSSRYRRIKPGILKGYWGKEEDQKLIQAYAKHGKNWKLIAKELKNRSGKQVRDRFLNSLNPLLNKNKFTEEEDKRLLVLYEKYGPTWSKIANNLNNRSGDMVKNRFFSFLRKKIIPITKIMKFKKRVLINGKIKKKELSKKSEKLNLRKNPCKRLPISILKESDQMNCKLISQIVQSNNFNSIQSAINNNPNQNEQKLFLLAKKQGKYSNFNFSEISENSNEKKKNRKPQEKPSNIQSLIYNNNTQINKKNLMTPINFINSNNGPNTTKILYFDNFEKSFENQGQVIRYSDSIQNLENPISLYQDRSEIKIFNSNDMQHLNLKGSYYINIYLSNIFVGYFSIQFKNKFLFIFNMIKVFIIIFVYLKTYITIVILDKFIIN